MPDDTSPFTNDQPAESARTPALRFSRHFVVTWGTVDANDHMRNTAYFDAAAAARSIGPRRCHHADPAPGAVRRAT
jgi:hypothetical protein